MIPELHIEDYAYPLTSDRIAKYPLPERDSSKLLRYKDGKVETYTFRELPELLPEDAMMVFNETKVVPARLHFKRETGALVEIFCLRPILPGEYNLAFACTESCRWECVIGNSKRWKTDVLSFYSGEETVSPEVSALELKASLISKEGQTGVVEFIWKGGKPFSAVLELCGNIPIPPYLNRDTEAVDYERYQTLYAKIRGSVAAPTAGLHFTERVLEGIRNKGIDIENVCLHVGAGTFLPVKDSEVSKHKMHREPFAVSLDFLEKLYARKCPLIAVGTTSVRTLESLYYIGVSIIRNGVPEDVEQWAPYESDYSGISTEDALQAIIKYLKDNGLHQLISGTRIIIVPGFKFRIVDMLVTNFHQPESTLILLVSAFLNGDWKTVYDYALANDYRFLSYGDSSLLIRP
ncbi:MAG: S-adenosylmethionine:tRNA ribosyltransferase-isomerase [Bacteroidales bacterium]|nr:S-adenosylmethionine:tRNA ribosyltransferase-isomerase [Bacteroidales bacterium]